MKNNIFSVYTAFIVLIISIIVKEINPSYFSIITSVLVGVLLNSILTSLHNKI